MILPMMLLFFLYIERGQDMQEKNTLNADANKSLTVIMIISTFGGLLFGYDTGVINGALPYMSAPDQLNLTPSTEGFVVAGLLFGAALGSVIIGQLSDYIGRRKTILYLAVLFFAATVGCTLSRNAGIMIIGRFFLGIAVGGASVTVPTYLAEMSLTEKRGRMVTQNEWMIVIGQFTAFICNAVLGHYFGDTGHVWRYMLIIAALPAIFLFIGMLKMPESPRWLINNGKISEALGVLKKIRCSSAEAVGELESIKNAIATENHIRKISWRELTTPWVRRVVFIGIGVAAASQATGVNTIMFYGTQILKTSGFSTEAALIANTLNGLIAVIAVGVGMFLVGKVKRVPMFLIGLSGTTSVMACLALVSKYMSGDPHLPYVVLALTVTFLAFMQGCIAPVFWLLLAEFFPLQLRGLGMGVCVFFVWIVNFLIGLFFPILLNLIGLFFTFAIFVIIGLFSIFFVKNYVPETKGKSLEEIELAFRSGRYR